MTAGSDYESGPYTVTFTAGEPSATVMVSTMDDNTAELSEYFVVMINSTDRSPLVEIGSPNVAFITIEDPCMYAHSVRTNDVLYNFTIYILQRWCTVNDPMRAYMSNVAGAWLESKVDL